MGKYFFALLLTFILPLSEAFSGNESGHGGGGVVRNGDYITFGTAKVRITPEVEQDIPGLSLLLEAVIKMPLGDRWKTKLYNAVKPIGGRQYFRVEEKDLTSADLAEIKRIYADLFKNEINPNDITIFALTQMNETYLLPDFYKLKKDEEQAAILFHEGVWTINSSLTYKMVIRAEILFQNYVERSKGVYGFDSQLFDILRKVFRDNVLVTQSAALVDEKSGHLKSLIDKTTGLIPLATIFGSNTAFYYAASKWGDVIDYVIEFGENGDIHLMNLGFQNPNSEFLKELLARFTDIRKYITNGNSMNALYYRNAEKYLQDLSQGDLGKNIYVDLFDRIKPSLAVANTFSLYAYQKKKYVYLGKMSFKSVR